MANMPTLSEMTDTELKTMFSSVQFEMDKRFTLKIENLVATKFLFEKCVTRNSWFDLEFPEWSESFEDTSFWSSDGDEMNIQIWCDTPEQVDILESLIYYINA